MKGRLTGISTAKDEGMLDWSAPVVLDWDAEEAAVW
jgi:hypothetical protein